MKDFYYILGIKQTATTEDIKKAYRKLSLKFHPDKNDGDEFFTDRFKEIQEAYDTLIEPTKRNAYDKTKESTSFSQSNNGNNFTPEIEYFKSNKSSFEFDEEITFSWKTINSNRVTIKPFGQVTPIGHKTYKIKDFKNSKLTFELLAENTNIGREVKATLSLNNKTFQELYEFFKSKIKEDNLREAKEFEYQQSKNIPKYSESETIEHYQLFQSNFYTTLIYFDNSLTGTIFQRKSDNRYYFSSPREGNKYFIDKISCIKELYFSLTQNK